MIFLKTATALLLFAYPLLVYFGLSHIDFRWIAVALVMLLAIRGMLLPSRYKKRVFALITVGIIIAALVFMLQDAFYLRLYPVLMSGIFFCIFAYSLYRPPSVIETFARLYEFKDNAMPLHVIEYTRQVTKIWCAFFVLNAIVSIYSLFQSLEFWTLYNGFISYCLMGALFAGEFAYRYCVVKKREEMNR